MSLNSKRATWLFAGMAWATISGFPVLADDTELFFVDPSELSDARPNILFILDNSLSMNELVESQSGYDPSVEYDDAGCGVDRIYWTTSGGSTPSLPNCTSNNWFNSNRLVCLKAIEAFEAGGERFRGRLSQFNPSTSGSNQRKWIALSSSQKDRFVECRDDRGIHGETSGTWYARNGYSSPWGSSGSQEHSWTTSQTTLFSGNYMNWYYGPTGPTPKIDIVKQVATNLLNTINGVNVGLMQFNYDEGGPVAHAIEDIATARSAIQQKVNDITPGSPYSTWTPLSETLYEAAQYYRGGSVEYGNVGALKSVAESRVGGTSDVYRTPLEAGCQKNFIVYLSDGDPTNDVGANSAITSLPEFGTIIGASCDGSGDGRCLDDLAEYLYKADLSDDIDGDQNVVTYMIGFAFDHPLLASTATRGGGAYFTANDAASLTTALTQITSEILNESTTFTAPAVSVNSFNRTQNLNDLYISVFSATGDAHWPGNLKKYQLRPSDGAILDSNDSPAVNAATGFFADGAHSYWSASADGPNVQAGGAANNIPAPASRKVYTYLGDTQLTAATNQVISTNLAIDDALLNTTNADGPSRDEILAFIRGANATDQPRNQMGDPLHSQPVSVMYGEGEMLVFFATNDGFLHAIDADTGIEQWAFVPPEFLDDQVDLYVNQQVDSKHYGIDGSIRVQMVADNDGVVEAGEKVYLFFGMRRGGDFYYGLDVTDPDAPKVLWSLPDTGLKVLPGNGQSWSNPVPARINIQGATQNSDKLVLLLGGGYDTRHDDYNMTGTDAVGNSIYIVDSESGNLLWRGTQTGGDANFAKMSYSIPSDIKVIDLNSDGYADRMYAADMGGQVWRFDIANGQSAGNLVQGGVIAQLGGAPEVAPTLPNTRRFYYSPDVALVSGDPSYVHIGIGSGHRAHPNSVFNSDRFYALRDYNTFNPLTQSQYDAITPIVDGDLTDVTGELDAVVPHAGPGWKYHLGANGEKVLAEARTFNNQVFFTTFTPGAGAGGNTNDCEPVLGTNRLYIMSLFNGAPVNNLDGSADEDDLTEEDRYMEFTGSIASEVVFIFPSPEDPEDCVGEECTPAPLACVDLFCFPPGFGNDPVRTFWSQDSID